KDGRDDAAVVVNDDRWHLPEHVRDDGDDGDPEDVQDRDAEDAERDCLEARTKRVLALKASRHRDEKEQDRLPADAVPRDVERETSSTSPYIEEGAVVRGGDSNERERPVHEPSLDRRDPLPEPRVEPRGHRGLREELTEGREERQDEQRDRRRCDERADRSRRARKSRPRPVGSGHGRLRFHQRAASGKAGAIRSRPSTFSGTIVARVKYVGCASIV